MVVDSGHDPPPDTSVGEANHFNDEMVSTSGTFGQNRGLSEMKIVDFTMIGEIHTSTFVQHMIDQLRLIVPTLVFAPIAGAESVISLLSDKSFWDTVGQSRRSFECKKVDCAVFGSFRVTAFLQGSVDHLLLVNSTTAFAPIAGAKSENSLFGGIHFWGTLSQNWGSSECNSVDFVVFGRNHAIAFLQGIVDQLLLVNSTVAFAPIAGAESASSLFRDKNVDSSVLVLTTSDKVYGQAFLEGRIGQPIWLTSQTIAPAPGKGAKSEFGFFGGKSVSELASADRMHGRAFLKGSVDQPLWWANRTIVPALGLGAWSRFRVRAPPLAPGSPRGPRVPG